jgi:hypothetical protein
MRASSPAISRRAASTEPAASRELPQYTIRANRLFSPLTYQVWRTIVDTAVRVEPGWRCRCIRAASKKYKAIHNPAGNRVVCANARMLGDDA